MDSATIVATASAAISLLAMGIAIWQGTSAHRAADAAKGQAASSSQAAAAAERAATAAEVANEVQRQQIDEAAGPEFQCVLGLFGDQSSEVAVEITMIKGPPLNSVSASAVGNTLGVSREDNSNFRLKLALGPAEEGDSWTIKVGLQRVGRPELAQIHLDCRDHDGTRQWRRTYPLEAMKKLG
ncbi:hypothetical protein [Amycolatopsis sp. NPDC003676]